MSQSKFMDNEQFYKVIQEIREIVKNPENLKCTCPNTYCEWYGKCRECVAQHRYYGKHIPTCLQSIIKEKINALVKTAELSTSEDERSTIEHWQYVHEMDKPNATIRLAKPDDAPDMAEIHARSWEVAYKDIIPMEYIKTKNATRPDLYKRIITDENTTQYVIRADGKTVGIMGIDYPQDNDVGNDYYELRGIYLHPDYYRKGIGTQVVNFAFDKARKLGKRFMNVWVFAENYNSIKFYEKCGFIADGKTKIYECGKPMECIRMKKDL